VTGPSVHVVLEAKGIEIAPAAEQRAGTAHHHLFLDTDVTAGEVGIPAGTPGIVHLGKGQSDYTFEVVTPGPHRLIAVLADPNHVPLKPLVADTVRFTVKP
jgi:Ethanolamine utilization protein EutJ (predicted chaperonin)